MATFNFTGSLTANLQATRRNVRKHSLESVTHSVAGAWAAGQHAASGRKGIPVATLPRVTAKLGGATRRSALLWVGSPKTRRIPRTRSYGPRDVGEARRVMQTFRLSQRFGISTQHPGGLLAFNRRFGSGPRAGQLPTQKVPANTGFFGEMNAEAEKRFKNFNFRPEGPKK